MDQQNPSDIKFPVQVTTFGYPDTAAKSFTHNILTLFAGLQWRVEYFAGYNLLPEHYTRIQPERIYDGTPHATD
jgi:hypothetical protein